MLSDTGHLRRLVVVNPRHGRATEGDDLADARWDCNQRESRFELCDQRLQGLLGLLESLLDGGVVRGRPREYKLVCSRAHFGRMAELDGQISTARREVVLFVDREKTGDRVIEE